jgi:hypothetical protein
LTYFEGFEAPVFPTFEVAAIVGYLAQAGKSVPNPI